MDWWMIECELSDQQHVKIEVMRDFTNAYKGAGKPEDAALFSNDPPDGNMKMSLYLSPACTLFGRHIIEKHDAQPCGPPPSDSRFLVGCPSAVSLLQSERR